LTREHREEIAGLLPSGKVFFNELMSGHTTFGAGGPADVMAVPDDLDELKRLVEWADGRAVDYTFLGNGSKTLVRDEGLKGLVICQGGGFDFIEINGETADVVLVSSGAATKVENLVRRCMEQGLSGVESLVIAGGTVGGCILTYAGDGDVSITDIVEEVTIINRDRRVLTIRGNSLRFEGRKLRVPRTSAIIRAVLRLKRQKGGDTVSNIDDILRQKENIISGCSGYIAGVFNDFERTTAADLVEDAGLKNVRIGGARVSSADANLIVNEGKATVRDVVVLMNLIRDRVKQQTGILLEPAISIVGRRET